MNNTNNTNNLTNTNASTDAGNLSTHISLKHFFQISFLLFGFFFGAGNLIFPPMMGYEAGANYWQALVGFAITAVIFPVMGIIVISKSQGIVNLCQRISPLFAVVFPLTIYLAIGPGLGIPRAGSLPFALAISPLIANPDHVSSARLIYTLVFFSLTIWLSLTPHKILKRVGQILTPILLLLIISAFLVIFYGSEKNQSQIQASYATSPFLTGIIKGYDTMDALASLNFGFAIALAAQSLNLKSATKTHKIIRYGGWCAGLMLFAVYGMLAYIGANTFNRAELPQNGTDILVHAVKLGLGSVGLIILIMIFSLACLTTCVGLVMSISEFFAKLIKYINYKQAVWLIAVISCLLANFGLEQILKFSIPVLLAMSPVSMVLIIIAYGDRLYHGYKCVYQLPIYTCLMFSILDVLKVLNILGKPGIKLLAHLPLNSLNLGWIVPTLCAFVISLMMIKSKGWQSPKTYSKGKV